MKVFNFKDTNIGVIITFAAESEDAAWAFLVEDYGTGYVFENIELLDTEIR